MPRRIAPLLVLLLLSPITAEFLLGDQYLIGPPSFRQLGMFIVYLPFYGGGAVLIRELARRTGRGWPTMLLLALGFALIEEGTLTQSLFNPNYAGARLLDYGHIPALGVAGPWTVFVLSLHVIWSIGAPIAVTEALFPGREPWSGKPGMGVVAAAFGLGAVTTFAISMGLSKGFLASPAQLGVVVLVAAVLIFAAFRITPASRPPARKIRPGFALGLGATVAFQLVRQISAPVPAWVVTLLMLAVWVAAGWAVFRLRPSTFGLGAGAVITYCLVGLGTAAATGAGAMVEQLILVALTVVFLMVIARKVESGEPAGPTARVEAGRTLREH